MKLWDKRIRLHYKYKYVATTRPPGCVPAVCASRVVSNLHASYWCQVDYVRGALIECMNVHEKPNQNSNKQKCCYKKYKMGITIVSIVDFDKHYARV